ncbi:hypothetical protein PVAND_001856 [Polypedilum vanderplanki]|uniref:Uncharacterized protein n=1 Tax=Polypedilum vanderplanki TaxID=319348 RepID=A0A9J6BP86_POLVA|nr:hypothetical protein PVAND_001856 [Polypedilum vanderplanki]
MLETLLKRYGPTARYKQLSKNSIIWKGNNEEVVFEIERLTIEVLKELGIYANSTNDVGGSGGTAERKSLFIVYLTKLKDEDDRCFFVKIIG